MCLKTDNFNQEKCCVKNKKGKEHKNYALFELHRMAKLGLNLLEQEAILCLISGVCNNN